VSTRDIVLRLVAEVWNGDGDTADQLVDPGCPGLGGTGPAAVVAWHRDRRTAFPDLHYDVVDLVVEGERAVLRWRAEGHQRGDFGPLPATGRAVAYDGASFVTVRGALVVDVWSVNDLFGLVTQLGATVVPPAEGD
jgi:SnoaL-like polyketide cyclase